jgi:hypothetical protein
MDIDEEECTHEGHDDFGHCYGCGESRQYDDGDEHPIRAASQMTGCQNRGWYHDGSEEQEAFMQRRPVMPCPHGH